MDNKTKQQILNAQKDEIESYYIYKRIAKGMKDEHNRDIINTIADDEKKHYDFLKEISGQDIKPSTLRIWFYYMVLRLLGLTFGVRLMELGEIEAQKLYKKLTDDYPQAKEIYHDEEHHEDQLIEMLNEDLLKYVGSIVLGLSDALVELTGALAGLTFALQNTTIIALSGTVTGISAALSMGASEYLSSSEEKTKKNPFKAAIYTGSAYMLTVVFLIAPYLIILDNPELSLAFTMLNAIIIIIIFTFYISVAKNLEFKGRLFKNMTLTLGVALISLIIGLIVKNLFNISI